MTLSQPSLTMVGKSMVNHGWQKLVSHDQPWLAKALSTMINFDWQKHCQPCLAEALLTMVKHG